MPSKTVVGGIGAAKAPDHEANNLCETLKGKILSKLGKAPSSSLEVVLMKTQVVAGTNYFLKLKVENNEYHHARVFKPLSGEPEVTSVQSDHTATSDIGYF